VSELTIKDVDLLCIAEHCERLGRYGIDPNDRNLGLCYEISLVFSENISSLVDFSEWPEFSGRDEFPVFGPDEFHCVGNFYRDEDDLWGKDARGCKRRRFFACG
jgi:hypothetical protein